MEREKRLRRQKEFLIRAAYWGVWTTAAVCLVKYVGAALFPFLAAFVVAWALSFVVDAAVKYIHVGRKTAAVCIVILFYALIALLLYLLGWRVVELLRGCASELTCFFKESVAPFLHTASTWGTEILGVSAQGEGILLRGGGNMASEISGKIFDGVSAAAGHIPGICMNLFLTLIATMLMELEFPNICAFLEAQVPKRFQVYVHGMKKYVMETLGKCAFSYCLILGMTFLELTVGLLFLRVEGAVVIAFIIAILDILPVLGTGMVLLPWAVIAASSGNLPLGIGLVALYVVVTIVRNIAEPHLVGRQMGLSPVVTLIAMIVGLQFLGIAGLFLLPIATALLKSLNDSGVIHIFQKHERREEEREQL